MSGRGHALPCDYDADPERWQRRPAAAKAVGDVHEIVAERIVTERLMRVLDVGSGRGRLRELLPHDWLWLGLDSSSTQLRNTQGPVVCGTATHLPFKARSFDVIAALWMLYHLEEPIVAIREAHRVLADGGLFVASSTRRDDSPEVQPAREPTTFDAEDAPNIVGEVFEDIEIDAWDQPMFTLPDRRAVREYLISRMADPSIADGVRTPVTITKRGCLVWGRKG